MAHRPTVCDVASPAQTRGELPLSPLEQLELIPAWKRGVVLIGAFALAVTVLALTLHGLASAVLWLAGVAR